jgi:hypothetical protein
MRMSMRGIAGGVPVARQGIALLVAAVLLWIAPLAYSEPPDPLWLGGIWDDDDFDRVVAAVKSTEAPFDLAQSVFVPLEPSLYTPPTPPEWQPIRLPGRWPENRAPPDA